MTENRLRAILNVIKQAYPGDIEIDFTYEEGYYWVSTHQRDEDGPYTLTGFLSRDEIWQWTDEYAAAIVLLRMALVYAQEN